MSSCMTRKVVDTFIHSVISDLVDMSRRLFMLCKAAPSALSMIHFMYFIVDRRAASMTVDVEPHSSGLERNFLVRLFSQNDEVAFSDSYRTTKGVHELPRYHSSYLVLSDNNCLVNHTELNDDKSHHVIGIGKRIMVPPDAVKHLIKRKQFRVFMVLNANVANGGENELFASGSFARGSTSSLSSSTLTSK